MFSIAWNAVTSGETGILDCPPLRGPDWSLGIRLFGRFATNAEGCPAARGGPGQIAAADIGAVAGQVAAPRSGRTRTGARRLGFLLAAQGVFDKAANGFRPAGLIRLGGTPCIQQIEVVRLNSHADQSADTGGRRTGAAFYLVGLVGLLFCHEP